MKTIKYLTLILSGLAIASCNKIDSTAPDFSVSVEKANLSVNDTARFTFSGAPANIVFYSGEIGNDYDTKGIATKDGGAPEMIFTTALTAVTGSSTASNTSVLVSNDFSGNYTPADISAATWTDLTGSVTIPAASQKVVLTPYIVAGKPLYIAFRFKTVNPSLIQREVKVSNFSFKTIYDNQTYTNAKDVYAAGFGPFDLAGEVGKWNIPITSNSNNTFNHPKVDANSPADDDWAISKAFATNLIDKSVGIGIKSIAQAIPTYEYVFKKAGTYKVVFVASNSTDKDYAETIKEFTITVAQ